MPLVQPALNFNFLITMWDATPPFGGGALGTALSVGANLLGQFIFGGFSECSGLNAELDIESYNEGGANIAPKRFVKGSKFPNIVLKRGVSFNPDLWDWSSQVVGGTDRQRRKNGMIMLMDRGGPGLVGAGLPGLDRIPIAAWTFLKAFPEKVQGPTLNARGNEIAIETLELSHEGLTRVSPSMVPGLGDLAGSLSVSI